MKTYIVVYNPLSGKGNSKKHAEDIVCELIKREFTDVRIFESTSKEDLNEYFKCLNSIGDEGAIVISVGGDGTLGTVIHAILSSNIDASVAVYPAGTANDFATFSHMPKNINKFIDVLLKTTPLKTDVAKVNGYYAINAIGVGNFSNGGTVYSSHAKKYFGKLGYYFKCVFSAFAMRSCKLSIKINEKTIEDEFLFLYIVNSQTAGGFKKFAPNAEIYDGKFDFVGIKNCNIFTFTKLFFEILLGKHINNKHVVYAKGSDFKVDKLAQNDKFNFADLDGNVGPALPLEIEITASKIKIYKN
ncbi:MAG: diacylglycerol kinase family lipid kinase [Clostridia bacterium]